MTKTYTLTVTPYYNDCNSQYYNIITINRFPEGNLAHITRRIKMSNKQPQMRNFGACAPCLFALARIDGCGCNECPYLVADDVPDLFSYLLEHGYVVNTSLTKMMNTSEIGLTLSKILCFITYTP